ncbi:unnamed protein product [Toxocara canis]|uniref:Methyltransferase n=1 Tax=Toxocara canis TaxID=6265 RepID=A0A183U7A6_TOXCA|nr:unnamed protein product [Toxocara canis]
MKTGETTKPAGAAEMMTVSRQIYNSLLAALEAFQSSTSPSAFSPRHEIALETLKWSQTAEQELVFGAEFYRCATGRNYREDFKG